MRSASAGKTSSLPFVLPIPTERHLTSFSTAPTPSASRKPSKKLLLLADGYVAIKCVINRLRQTFLVLEKPTRVVEWGKWCDCGDYIELDSNLFPDLTWDDDPIEVEIIIKKEEMITVTIIICITVLLIVAIICYKEYKLSNGSNFERIESKLNSLDIALRCNDRIIGNLADSIREFKEEMQNEHRTSK